MNPGERFLRDMARETPARARLTPLPAQLDLDGGAHELAPQTRQERLFAPAPNQLAGQTHLDTDAGERKDGP